MTCRAAGGDPRRPAGEGVAFAGRRSARRFARAIRFVTAGAPLGRVTGTVPVRKGTLLGA
ncbi:hypothetical protein C6Q14_03690 [Burkholderia ambifaria]|nr:hypothetical protein C6Q14_03690 [Burkholderia ambifaria]